MMFEPRPKNGLENMQLTTINKDGKNKVRVGEGWKCKWGKNIPGTQKRKFKGL